MSHGLKDPGATHAHGGVGMGLLGQAMALKAGLYSTANDMLKFISANLGLTPSSLTPLVEKALQLRLDPQGGDIVHIPGVTICYSFDKTRRRGAGDPPLARGKANLYAAPKLYWGNTPLMTRSTIDGEGRNRAMVPHAGRQTGRELSCTPKP